MSQPLTFYRIQLMDTRSSILIFWSILAITSIFSLVISFMFESTNMIMVTTMPVIIFIAITSFVSVKGMFPFTIHLGVTRKQYVTHYSIFLVLFTLGLALINQLFNFSINVIVDFFHAEQIQFLYLTHFLEMPAYSLNDIIIDWMLFLLFGFVNFFLASLLYRYGKIAVYCVISLCVLIFLIPNVQHSLFKWIQGLVESSAYPLFIFIPICFVFALLSYVTLKRSAV
ncbi:hypothetical protein [Alkalihalobacillus sp. LMS39]|uniref:hypothetical protein n=1 Tax=Alkalihalobacillus sp. LMS39 TaxID=2924032 RepID=UPI001FB202A0|nr:hypothetical protein [Alkalihalobacillus sp. LMS39]UOE95606.1 hypothetical protein MM271_08370 [Alkalihalobacillus sp. LMS39]